MLEHIGGIQAQYAPSMYVGMWSRMRSLERDELTRALEGGKVVQGTLLRGTIHLVSREDYWPFAVAIRQQLREWFLTATKGDPPEAELDDAAQKVLVQLREGPLRQAEIDELVGRSARGGINMFLDLVRVPPSGTWERRRADLHAEALSWIGRPDISTAASSTFRRTRRGSGSSSASSIRPSRYRQEPATGPSTRNVGTECWRRFTDKGRSVPAAGRRQRTHTARTTRTAATASR